MPYDPIRYAMDSAYRRRIEACRRGGRSRSKKKIEAARSNVAKSPGRPRKDGLVAGWQKKGLDPFEAEKSHRKAEADRTKRRQRELMRSFGWSLESEWQRSDAHRAAGTDEDFERETGIHIGEELGPGLRAVYEEWTDGGKNLEGDEDIPDGLLRALCRYRLASAPPAVPESIDGFAI